MIYMMTCDTVSFPGRTPQHRGLPFSSGERPEAEATTTTLTHSSSVLGCWIPISSKVAGPLPPDAVDFLAGCGPPPVPPLGRPAGPGLGFRRTGAGGPLDLPPWSIGRSLRDTPGLLDIRGAFIRAANASRRAVEEAFGGGGMLAEAADARPP